MTFAAKPRLAERVIERAAGAAVPFAWVAGGEVYGDNGPLRTCLETRCVAHVLAVACEHRVAAGAGRTLRTDQLAARLPGKAWQRASAGAGDKGHRCWYRWVGHPRHARCRSRHDRRHPEHAHGPGPADRIPLTRNEIAHLLSSLTIRPAHDITHQMSWSSWRRRHQHRARTCHYQRQQPKTRGHNDLRLE